MACRESISNSGSFRGLLFVEDFNALRRQHRLVHASVLHVLRLASNHPRRVRLALLKLLRARVVLLAPEWRSLPHNTLNELDLLLLGRGRATVQHGVNVGVDNRLSLDSNLIESGRVCLAGGLLKRLAMPLAKNLDLNLSCGLLR